MPPGRWLPRFAPLVVTLMVALTLLVPAAYLLAPRVHHWRMIGGLTSDDLQLREQALNYVISRAPEEPAVVRGAIAALDGARNPSNFLQIATALERAGYWTRHHVPDEPWIRWLSMLVASGTEEARTFAAQRLGDLGHRADDPRLARLLGELYRVDAADTRYNALVSAAALAAAAREPAPLLEVVREAASDPQPRIARHAWIFLGLLRSAPLPGVDPATAPPEVADAILWAWVTAATDGVPRAIAALHDTTSPPHVRAAAAYALSQTGDPAARDALLAAAAVPAPMITPRNQLVVWRAILGLPRPDLQAQSLDRLAEVVAAPAWDEGSDPLVEPIALASVYRMGIAGARRHAEDPGAYDTLLKLATVEGQAPPYMEWPLTGDKPPLLRVMTVDVSRNPHIGDLRPAFTSDISTIRELAAVVAAQKFDRETLAGMAESLLKDFSDEARMSGALLSGLTGVQPGLLRTRYEIEDRWDVRQVLALGLWMQGELPQFGENVGALLTRADVPQTAVLLAMLHHGQRREALDWLLNPRGEPPVDLVDLLDQLRWWRILRDYLPTDAPPFWVWGDPAVESFQVDVLRDWYLLHRPRLATVQAGTANAEQGKNKAAAALVMGESIHPRALANCAHEGKLADKTKKEPEGQVGGERGRQRLPRRLCNPPPTLESSSRHLGAFGR